MASSSSTRSESPVDIDFSVIRTSIQMGHKMIDQILQGIHYGSEEVRNLLREECDFILECKVCRNLFRSFPNFVAHKRVYCMEYYEEKVGKDNLEPVPADEETVIVHPEAPEEENQKNKNENATSKKNSAPVSNIEKVVNRTFDGKSKEYQLYTKVAEDLEKRKATKVTNTVVLTPMAGTSNAVVVTHAKGDKSCEIPQRTSPKKQSPVKSNEEAHINSPAKKKNSVLAVCADLAKKKLLQDGKVETVNALPLKTRASVRSRKSSPRKSTEYLEMSGTGRGGKADDTEQEVDMEDWNEEKTSPDRKLDNSSMDKELLKFCDLKNFSCKACKKKCTSLYNLKLHAKIKHGLSIGKYPCSICESKFEHLKSLYKHLRQKHHRSEQYISKIKDKYLLNRSADKSTEDMEVEEDSGSSPVSSSSPPSPVKENKNMLSFSTGWKKCDKCGKVCWKAKSFYRHYSQCKGPGAKSESNSSTNSLLKSGKQNASGSQKNSTALLKLQEKLRAGVLQPDSSDMKNKLREKSLKSESEAKSVVARERASAERSVDSKLASTELYKVLTQPLGGESQDTRAKLNASSDSRENGQLKTYNLRLSNQSNEKEEKTTSTTKKDNPITEIKVIKQSEKGIEIVEIGSPALKKLEEKLVREAGLTDTPRTEMKVLEQKLTREAPGHNKDSKEPERNESIEKQLKENDVNESKKTLNESKECTEENTEESKEKSDVQGKDHDALDEPDSVQVVKGTKQALSEETENRKERISERFRSERMTSQEQVTQADSKTRSSRSVSSDSEHRIQEKTPEKFTLMTNSSPVSSPGRSSILPSSPTPSLQSNSGDSYNMKFKMTVQEMAELVESASLTKFAKERKKRAKSFLNSKQVKDSQKIAASLSKPMKRGTKRKNIIIRNVYGTRNKTPGIVTSEESKFVPSTRLSEHKTEGSDSSANALSDKQDASRRMSREQKRLQNSAGFVEKNFYAVSSSRESSKDRHSDADSEKKPLSRERKRLENSQGFVDKVLLSEAEVSSEKDKRSIHKPDKSSDKTDDERNAKEHCTRTDGHASSKLPFVKSLAKSELDISESLNKEKSEAVKPKNVTSSKKTVLYVGKHFTDKIKCIQQNSGSDVAAETSENMTELRSKNRSEVGQKEHLVDEVQQKSGEKNIQDKQTDLPKHRTRLATGSIFFDSELLKLSPTKIEKKFAELNKAKDVMKGRLEKEGSYTKDAASVRKRLSLSPRKIQVEKHIQHLRSNSGPQRFSLATGVKQCQKCHKTFWKKKAYVFHLVNSSCSDKSLSRLDRKRALSLSPEGIAIEGGRFAAVKSIFKRPKRDESLTGKELKDTDTADSSDKTTEDTGKEPIRMTRNQAGSAAKSSGNTDVSNKTNSFETANEKNDEIDKSEHRKITKSSAGLSKELAEKETVKEDRTLRRRVMDDKSMNAQEKTFEKVKKNMTGSDIPEVSSSANMEVDVTGSKICKNLDINKNDTEKQSNSVKVSDVPETVKTNPKQSKDIESDHQADLSVPHKETSKSNNEHVNKEHVTGNVNAPVMSDEVPSTSLSSLFSEDSDGDSSDFSGFSEEDLKLREQELSQMDVGDYDELEDDPEDNVSDDDLGQLSDYIGSGNDIDPDPKPDDQATSVSQRPVRKSAQNRFGHVEEIWVYKEPGKPVVEKTKCVKNREYVMDVTNPSKLHCHNSKDVDRLIDEKNLKCIQCETPCTSISNLRRHVIRHLGWKRYKCKHCTYTCYDMSYCRQHVLRAHDENLTNKNFDKFITDLKKEATKKRAAKRTNTLHKTKQNSLDEEMYKKTRTNTTNQTDQGKVNSPIVSDSKTKTNQCASSKSLRSKDSQHLSVTNESSNVKSDVFIKSEPGELPIVKTETVKVGKKLSLDESPLDRARMNLVKALRDK